MISKFDQPVTVKSVRNMAKQAMGANGHNRDVKAGDYLYPLVQAGKAENTNPAQASQSVSKNRNTSQSIPVLHKQTTNDRLGQLSNEIKEITSLFNIGVAATSSLNIDEVLWTLYKESSSLIDTSNLAIVVYNASTDQLNFALVFDEGRRVKPRQFKLADNKGLAARVLTGQTALLVHDLMEKQTQDIQREPTNQRHVRSWLGVPISNPALPQMGTLGVIAIWSYEPHKFSDHDLWLLSAIATQAAIAIRNAGLHESVLAERDRVVEAEENARKTLARDLHDGPTQLLSALSMRLDFCQALLEKDPNRLAEEIKGVQDLTAQAVNEIRTLLFELRPLILETDGLVPAVQIFLERRQQDVKSKTRLVLSIKPRSPGHSFTRQDSRVESALYAIIREITNNALQHAQARTITIELQETESEIWATVIDDGIGFDVEGALRQAVDRGSMGLVNIRERAALMGGELILTSNPGKGTKTIIRVPKAETERNKRRIATGPLSPLISLMVKKDY